MWQGNQIEIAKNLLLKNGFNVIATREPGGIGESEKIRKLIFDLKERKLIGAEGQMVMFFTARKFWVDGLVAPSIDKGIHVFGRQVLRLNRCIPGICRRRGSRK